LRVYNGALSPTEIAATQALGGDGVLTTNAPAVNAAVTGGNLTLSWPLGSAGYTVLMTTNLVSGVWMTVPVTPQIVGGQWQASPPLAGGIQYFRLQK